ncbi:malonic semialdehyde reductase [Azospirillum sp. TSO22-1]|uniref:malonic semialdehyde reductase n=1 Tax=Azospirillum sp. TSO22-1 TaxID=716789 RepID=UPI000D60EDC7|nr:malonic semialdehyde reductase [Azospirillum sp. TSO22-1]PWC44303.1 hypothetical protein TSO221_17935 [Azospirillum sp. TSO22-1]
MPDTLLARTAEELLFTRARTPSAWQDRRVDTELLHQLWNLARLPPTAFNAGPARLLFLVTPQAKARLLPTLSKGNIAKVQAAPVTAVVARDTRFYDELPRLFPQYDARALFIDNPDLAEKTGVRNATLQGAYLILAARLLGLDAWPMGGFDAAAVDAEFFPDGLWRAEFLVNLGYGTAVNPPERNPRLGFDEACRVL